MTDSKIFSLIENSLTDITNIAGVQSTRNQTVTLLKSDMNFNGFNLEHHNLFTNL